MQNQQDAALLVGLKQGQDIMDCYEEKLFDFKKFFLQKPVVRKLYESTLKKVERMEQAFAQLGIKNEGGQELKLKHGGFSEEILKVYHEFQGEMNRLKFHLNSAETMFDLKQVVLAILELNDQYLGLWPEVNFQISEEVKISQFFDTMYLLEDLKVMNNSGVRTFNDLTKKNITLPKYLKLEWSRISKTKELDGRKSV